MSTNLQEVEADAQQRSRRILQTLIDKLHSEETRTIMGNLPSYKNHKIIQVNNEDLVLYLGHNGGSKNEPLYFSLKGKTNCPDIGIRQPKGMTDISFFNSYASGDKAPFDWSEVLYEKLIRQVPELGPSAADPPGAKPNMYKATRALLDYYFLQWAANSSMAVNFRLPKTFDVDADQLSMALDAIQLSDRYHSLLEKQKERESNPSLNPAQSNKATNSETIHFDTSDIPTTHSQPSGDDPFSTTHVASSSGAMAITGTSFASKTVRELRNSIKNLTNLPSLESIQIEDITENGRKDVLPLRLCIGHQGEDRVWMYIKKGINHPLFEIERSPETQNGTYSITLKIKNDIISNRINLLEPFQTGKAGGSYMDPLVNIGKYYFFFACATWNQELGTDDIVMNNKFEQYLQSGANAYRKEHRLRNSQPTLVDREESATETVEAAQTTLGLPSSIADPSTSKKSDKIILSPTSPPLDQQGPSGSWLSHFTSPDDEILDMGELEKGNDGLEKEKDELLERRKSLDDQILYHRNEIVHLIKIREEVDAALGTFEGIEHDIQSQEEHGGT